jgi:hypothetical protein
LAAIGRRVCEVERDVLELLEPDLLINRMREAFPLLAAASARPHDRPTADELLIAVQEWIVALPLEGRDRFLSRVAGRGLDVVRRELSLGPQLAARHAERLTQLGVESDAVLARQVRDGRDDPEVAAAICDTVIDKLRVADPRQLDDSAR